MTNEPEEHVLPEGYEVGDWDFDPKTDPAWDDPKIPRRRIPNGIFGPLVQDAIQGKAIQFCIIENLRGLIEAIQAHPSARLTGLGKPNNEGKTFPAGVFDHNGKELDGNPTQLILLGCILENVQLNELDIKCAIQCNSRFNGDAVFQKARFFDNADFSYAKFEKIADFSGVNFENESCFARAVFCKKAHFIHAIFDFETNFSEAIFKDDASFDITIFEGDAEFTGTQFDGNALFPFVKFNDTTSFEDVSFNDGAIFRNTSFDRNSLFRGAVFKEEVNFDFSNFEQEINFSESRIKNIFSINSIKLSGTCLFGTNEGDSTQLPANNDFRGDLRRADVRWVQLQLPSKTVLNGVKGLYDRFIFKYLQRISWTLIRAIGELSILGRVSFLALIFVPMLASAWPAIRVGVTGYNDSVTELSNEIQRGAEALHDFRGQLEGGVGESLIDEVDAAEKKVQGWSKKFESMAVDEQNLPLTMAFAFFAAACVTIGQLLYQSNVPATVRKYDEEAFIEWMHGRYHDKTPDRADGLRRACEYLKVIADAKPERNANFVKHHNEMIWIPPKDKIEWFEDVELEDGESYPEGYVPAAERERIALEEGAKAEYWYHAQKSKGYARACFFAYAIGMILLGVILVLQGINVARAAGL